MLDMIKAAGDVPLYDPVVFIAVIDEPIAHCYTVHRASVRTEAAGTIEKITLPNWFHEHLEQHLYNSVLNCRDAEWSFLAIRFWNVEAFDRIWAIHAGAKLLLKLFNDSGCVRLAFKCAAGNTIHSWSAAAFVA